MIDLPCSFFFVSVNQRFRGDICRILKATEVEEFQSSNQNGKKCVEDSKHFNSSSSLQHLVDYLKLFILKQGNRAS